MVKDGNLSKITSHGWLQVQLFLYMIGCHTLSYHSHFFFKLTMNKNSGSCLLTLKQTKTQTYYSTGGGYDIYLHTSDMFCHVSRKVNN